MLVKDLFNYCSLFLLVNNYTHQIIERKPLSSKVSMYGMCVYVLCLCAHVCR